MQVTVNSDNTFWIVWKMKKKKKKIIRARNSAPNFPVSILTIKSTTPSKKKNIERCSYQIPL